MSLWKSYVVDRSYYLFWGALAVVLIGGPAAVVIWQLNRIRLALERLIEITTR